MKAEKQYFSERIQMVEEFHKIFKIPYKSKPELIDEKLAELRHHLMVEENNEYLDACKSGDLVGIADALGDQLYVLFGTIVSHGLQDKMEEIFAEIHRSNLSKLDENNQPILREDGKILKGKLFFRPDIQRIIERK